MSVKEAIIEAGCNRMRAILLTSATTFGGLAPLIAETSIQAQFLIPAAVSLGYGILFATIITLILIPALVMVVDDFGRVAKRKGKRKGSEQEALLLSRAA